MPTWDELRNEIGNKISEYNDQITNKESKIGNVHNQFRHKYLKKLHDYTGRDVILYTTAWTTPKAVQAPSGFLSITDGDIQGFMGTLHKMDGDELDLIIHSPGGSAESAEYIVRYLRKKYKHIRTIVPNFAMSAATMVACGSDEIIMGKQSYLGPIDPQVVIPTHGIVPAQVIIDQFNQAFSDFKDSEKLAFWSLSLKDLVTLGFPQSAHNAIEFGKKLVSDWLEKFMFKDHDNPNNIANSIADHLSDHNQFKSHGKGINIDDAIDIGLKVIELEDDQNLQDFVLSIAHLYDLTFNETDAYKIIENHLGKSRILGIEDQNS